MSDKALRVAGELAEACGITSGMLDDLVHDAANQRGSNVNNDGLDSQIEFLLEEWGAGEVVEQLHKLIRKKQEKNVR